MSDREQTFAEPERVSAVRIEAAVNKIVRVNARLALIQRGGFGPHAMAFPTEVRLLQEAVDLLNPEVKLA